jgi:hypothetical protein
LATVCSAARLRAQVYPSLGAPKDALLVGYGSYGLAGTILGGDVIFDELTAALGDQVERLRRARSEIDSDFPWYPYDILANLIHIDRLLGPEHRDLDRMTAGLPVADIGAADGDLAFVLEDVGGWEVDIVDTAATNMNGLRGARALRDHLGSRVSIHDIDLDRQFSLPRHRYGLAFLLGTLYHLQNPYFVLNELARRCSYCLVSTKVARFAGDPTIAIGRLPVAYLVDPFETNNDPTNYWILTPVGLERLVGRCGWQALATYSVGNVAASDPSTPAHDERMFMLLQSAV